MSKQQDTLAILKLYEPDYLIHLENLVRSCADFESKMESRKRLIAIWTDKKTE